MREWKFCINADEKIEVHFSTDGTNSDYWVSTSAITIDAWAYYLFTFATGTVRVYQNDIAIPGGWAGGGMTAIKNAGAAIKIGTQVAHTSKWEGGLQGIAIFDEVISTLNRGYLHTKIY